MRYYKTILILLFLANNVTAQKKGTIIKGKVKYWTTDTIYLQTMPFNSPHSSELKCQTITKDSTFIFEFKNIEKPFVVQLYLSKKSAENNKEHLLFLNLTDKYYYGHCEKFYTYGITTFLLEPNKTLNVELERNWSISQLSSEKAKKYRDLGIKVPKDNKLETTQKTSINFLGDDTFQNEYYQKSFNLDDRIDKRLDIYKNKTIEKAIVSFKKIKQKLLDELEANKNKLSTVFYDYIKAEIEFGARKEFLKFLMLNKEKEVDTFFSNEIPQEIMDIVEFDKTTVNGTTLISEEYNKFLMLYLNFKLNVKNKSYKKYYEYSKSKIKTAIRNFPKKSTYYFIANYLLQPETDREEMMKFIENEEDIEGLILSTIKKFPNSELNDKLIEKYDL